MTVKIRKGSACDQLNMTPLIDCIFQLVLFLLLATRFSDEDRELDVVLPSASHAVPLVVQPKELFINVDRDGRYFVDGKFLGEDELENILRRSKANNDHQTVAIRSDEMCHFKFVVSVMNLCNRVGIKDYSVATKGNN